MSLDVHTHFAEAYTLVHFTLGPEPLDCGALSSMVLPEAAVQRRHLGLILSGRGPVWLYAHLVHLGHAFAWVGTYDPRLNGAVVVARHVPDAPGLGDVISTPEPNAGDRQ